MHFFRQGNVAFEALPEREREVLIIRIRNIEFSLKVNWDVKYAE